MSSCELCGAPEAQTTAQVEGVQLKVCRNCQKHGSVKKKSSNYRGPSNQGHNPQEKLVIREGPEQKLVSNFKTLMREAREKRNLNNEDFAKLLQEKESTVAKWESGSMRPPILAAIKIGRILRLNFIEKEDIPIEQSANPEKSERVNHNKSVSDELTIGDFIKVRKR